MRFLLLALLLFLPNSVLATELPDFPFVVSSGEAKTDVKPDKAIIRISVLAFEEDSEKSALLVSVASDNILGSIKKFNIPISKIEASDVKKSTKRSRDKEYNRLNILGYEVSRMFTINIDDISIYSELMADLVSLENITDINSSFDYSGREKVKRNLMIEAGKKARASGENMANALGVTIHSVYAISQVSDFDGFFATFGAFPNSVSPMYDSRRPQGLTMFVPDTISISQHVNVVFRLEEN